MLTSDDFFFLLILLTFSTKKNSYSWVFGCKLVRGAYMDLERKLAAQKGYPDPICDTIEDTHKNYYKAIASILALHNTGVMIASHNQPSIEYTGTGVYCVYCCPDSPRSIKFSNFSSLFSPCSGADA